ncbi:MAG TPA: tRNA pseudouridine(13) synthase TruD [Marinobacter sp.]|nr:tRNA pseudouridine(13) synthase TruD [Marinobacter sp.]
MTDSIWPLDWPVGGGQRAGRAYLKAEPEDFRVDEILPLPPGVAGEHLCLYIEKRGDNTEYLARQLAALAGCRPMDVSFCGLKDRHAVTRQWFSLYRPGMEAEDDALIRQIGVQWPVREKTRLARKLRRGDHQANHFRIRLRDVQGEREAIESGLERLVVHGCPNYFGTQRFGHQGGNLDQAARMDPSRMGAGHRRKRRPGRHNGGGQNAKNVLYFSAARSFLFNEVLARRVADGSWQRMMDGEPEGSGVPTGPMWGDGGTLASGAQEQLEREVVGHWPSLLRLFVDTRMKPERRPLVCQPEGMTWQWSDSGHLNLAFTLPPGQYATTVLGDLFELENA